MSILDLTAERAKRERPDDDCVRTDDEGRELGLYALSYRMDGSTWSADIWAYSFEDAENRAAAMRASLVVLGQVHSIIPA